MITPLIEKRRKTRLTVIIIILIIIFGVKLVEVFVLIFNCDGFF